MVTRDWTLRAGVRVERALRDWTETVSTRMRGRGRDAGAGFVEYAGLMILIAGIYTLIDQLGLNGKISQAIGNAVGKVIGTA
ncbi:hypothetical protein OG585_28475 [Streptomyces sp. NBC_01340]|uniref:hypothetical protein n=1 Tax=Streptomyces sp. NBC_01340 TaxID=2903830 RepID=UPI002E0E052A|nr:hypothetical protein OG585_28475 [Streptomyces sp. NBC_01340]